MNYLSIFSFGLSILTFAAMVRGVFLQSKLKMLRNFNGEGANNLRIERVKKKARSTYAVSLALCLVTGAVCYRNQSYALAGLFAFFGAVAGLSFLLNRADRKLLAGEAARLSKDKKTNEPAETREFWENRENDLFTIAQEMFARYQKRHEDSASDENESFGDVLQRQRRMQIESEREKRKTPADDDDKILDSEYVTRH